MPELLERPQFYEGQILGAEDLTQLLDFSRAALARHERGLHLWGIVWGLNIEKAGDAYIVRKGIAIDSSGAQLILMEDTKVDRADVHSDVVLRASDNEKYFAVFLVGQRKEVAASGLLGACATQGATRVSHSAEITYRRDALDWDQQAPVDPDAGPDDSPQSDRLVLLGFVRYKDPSSFDDFQLEQDGIRPRFAGVRASTVQASGGKLFLRSQAAGTTGAPVVVLDQTDPDHAFVFGLDNGKGNIDQPLVHADSNGNLTASGTLTGALATGTTLVQSGSATDGVKLPLPKGITEEQIRTGNVAIQTLLVPRIDMSEEPPTGTAVWMPRVSQCKVDSDRRVKCQIKWVNVISTSLESKDLPGICDYLLVVTVSSPKGV